jgi:monoamine oxidase
VVWFNNYQRAKGVPILVGFIHSSYAIDMENKASSNGVSQHVVGGVKDAIDALSRCYPRHIVESSLVESHVTQWSRDPFSLGSYTHIATTGSGNDYEEMARSTGAIHFAGEATNRTWPCTVHSAFLSGAREAKKIKKRMTTEWTIPKKSK